MSASSEKDPSAQPIKPVILTQCLSVQKDMTGIEFSLNVKNENFYKTASLASVPLATRLVQLITRTDFLRLPDLESYQLFNKSVHTVNELAMPYTALNNPELREITLSSCMGTGTARGLAKLFSLLTGPTPSGEHFLSPKTLKALTDNVTSGICGVTQLLKTFGRGVQIFKNPHGEPVFGHAGAGGQMVIADPKNKISIAFLTNYLSTYSNGDDSRFLDIQKNVYSNLDQYIYRKKRAQGG